MWHEENKEQLSSENLHKQLGFSLAISVLISMGVRWEWAGAEDSLMWEGLESQEAPAELQKQGWNSAAWARRGRLE